MENKKGQVSFSEFITIGLVVAILGLFAIFSQTFRTWIIVGGISMSGIYLAIKSKDDRTRLILFGGVVLLVGGFLVFSGTLQSIFSVDQVTVGADGKVYWLATATVDSIDEGFQFTYSPSAFEKTDGTKIIPQSPLGLTFSKKDSYCKYTLQQVPNDNYKILSNPDRVSNIYIKDTKGNSWTVDGTIVDSKTIEEGLIVKTQGIISGKNDCPNYENVAILDGKIYEKDSLLRARADCGIFNIWACISPNINENTQFTSAFKTPPTLTENEIKGDINIGNAVFTVSANQDYFDSIIILPPKDVIPRVDSISIPDEVKAGDTTSIKVIISNDEDSEGIINVKATSNDLSISSAYQNVNLEDKVTVNFLATASNNEGSSQVCIETCATNQFGSSSCDSDCESFKIIKEQPAIFCGDGICQSSESPTTCSKDCEAPADCTRDSDCEVGVCKDGKCIVETQCAFYQEPYTKTEKDYGALYWRAYTPFVDPIETEISGCKTADWVSIAIFLIVAGGFGFAIYKTPSKRRRK